MVEVVMTVALAILAVLMVLLHVLSMRRISRLADAIDRQRRLLESMAAPSAAGGATAPRAAAAPRPTEPFAARTSPGLPDPSPRANERMPESSPRSTPTIGDQSPRSSPRLQELSPRSTPRLSEVDWRGAMARNPEMTAAWTPTHRITFTPDKGRADTWLVMIGPAPYGHRIAMTHAEWAAGVTPAWHCTPDGIWTCRGLRTPEGAKGKVAIEEMAP